jgi:alpha-glucosidase
MPYLYTLAEESSRTGLPMVRPLFLEFPDAAADRRPLDLDIPASGEFLLGGDLLIAPPPFPEELDRYEAEFPTTAWYDFWTGEKVSAQHKANADSVQPAAPAIPMTALLEPGLATLPVFVRAGAILPMAPLVQSTNETPQGALTLRVYAGDDCKGSLYSDDGKTYAYQHGALLRMSFACKVEDHALSMHISAHEGSYPAWWKNLRVEIYGWKPSVESLLVNGKAAHSAVESLPHAFAVTIPDDARGVELSLQSRDR